MRLSWSRALAAPALAALLTLGLAPGAGCGGGKTSAQDGKTIFREICAQCHGPDGHADPVWKARLGVPDLADPAVQGRLTDAQIRDTVANGTKSGKMPPWKSVLSPAQIDAVSAYVRTLKAP